MTFKKFTLLMISVLFFCTVHADGNFNERSIAEILEDTGEDTLFFIAMGDNRNGDEVFMRILNLASSEKPDFIIMLGDLVPSGFKHEYDNFMKMIGSCSVPIITVIGNHEIAVIGGREIYKDIFGGEEYYFDYKGARFIILDNSRGVITDGQVKWLDGLCKTEKKKFVFAHVPPKIASWQDHVLSNGSDKFIKVIKENRVDYAIFGHIHLYDKFTEDGTAYLITAGAGAPLYPNYGFGIPKYHYVRITVAEGKISDEVIFLNE